MFVKLKCMRVLFIDEIGIEHAQSHDAGHTECNHKDETPLGILQPAVLLHVETHLRRRVGILRFRKEILPRHLLITSLYRMVVTMVVMMVMFTMTMFCLLLHLIYII